MTTLKDIDQLDESKFNTILRPKAKSRPPKDCDILGFDMEWYKDEGNDRVISTQLAWYDESGTLRSRAFTHTGVDADRLLRLIEACLGRPTKRLVILISHFAVAEIGHITNSMKQFSIRQFNLALEAQLEFDFETTDDSYERTGGISGLAEVQRPKQKVILRIVDLMGFFNMSLEKVAKSIGKKKIDLADLGVENWKEHMDIVLHKFPKRFDEYVRVDAEIALAGFTRLRKLFLKREIDVVNFHTASSVGIEIFKRDYLKKPVAPFYKLAETYSAYDKRHQTWKVRTRKKTILRYDWWQTRFYGMLAYWGGRSEAYGRGLVNEKLTYYDVDSLYPSSAALQPLPNEETEWVPFRTLDETKLLEGFACVSFKFPEKCFYPSIPVWGFQTNRFYFPLRAEHCWITLAEVREARRLGATIQDIFGVGFKPTSAEKNHPLTKYVAHFVRLKREAVNGSLEYGLYKLILNGPMGKFRQTEKDFLSARVQKKYREGKTWIGYPILYQELAKISRMARRRVGSSWWPEAAALFLGKSRALMSQFIEKGAYFTSTDSVLLPRKTSIKCPALDQLKSVGSRLKKEGYVSRAWIFRTKCYVLWDDDGKLLHAARGGFNFTTKEEFARRVTEAIDRNSFEPLQTITRNRIAKYNEAMRTGYPLARDIEETRHATLNSDGKRVYEDFNTLREFRLCKPLPTVPDQVAKRGRPAKQQELPTPRPKPRALRENIILDNSQLFDAESSGVSIKR